LKTRFLRFGVALLSVGLVGVLVVGSGAATIGSRKAKAKACLAQHKALTDAGGSSYIPTNVLKRSAQIAIVFPFTPGEVDLGGIVYFATSRADAQRAFARTAAWTVGQGGSVAAAGRNTEFRGNNVVFWWQALPHAGATRILNACLGTRTER
jgi:hypothetical protein